MLVRFALAALLLTAAPALAQPAGGLGSVTGTVVDAATGEPLVGAAAVLYAGSDSSFVTGAAADARGAFAVEGVRPGRYLVRVTFVGYAPARVADVAVRPGVATALGELRLAPDDAALGEVAVEAQRDFVEQRADRTVYNVADQAVTAGGSALETLGTLPSVEVDTDGNLSLRGNQNVVVQINGRPVPVRGAFLASLLRQIPANRVARVEVVPNPSARYDPDGMSGIVNIVLLEGTDRGLSGGVTLGGGTQPSGELGANVSYQRGRWDLTGTYGFRRDASDLVGTSFRETFRFSADSLGLLRTATQGIANGRVSQSHFSTLAATYSLSPAATLTFEGSAGTRRSSPENSIRSLNTFVGASATETVRLTEGDGTGLNGDAALVFRQQFGMQREARGGAVGAPAGGGMGGGRWRGGGGNRGGGGTQGSHELAVEARVSRNTSSNAQDVLDETLAGVVRERSRADEDEVTTRLTAQADYVRPLGSGRLETGVKVENRAETEGIAAERWTGSAFAADARRSNEFDIDETVASAYVQASRGFGALELQAGLRAEAAERQIALSAAPLSLPGLPTAEAGAQSFRYQSLFPSAFATYTLAPGTLVKASYSRRVERPRPWALNPFPNVSDDTTSVRIGNPQLRPEYTDSFELTLQALYAVTVTPFYRRTTDVIRRRFLFVPEANLGVQTSQNLDTQDSFGADVTLLGQALGGRVRGFVSGSVARVVTDGGDAATGVAVDALNVSARGSVQVRVREGTDVQTFVFWRAPQKTEDGRVSGFAFTTLGLNQRITPQLSLSARVNDLFSTTRFEFTSATEQFRLEGVRDPSQRHVSATLTYTFGSGRASRPREQAPDVGGQDGFAI